MKTTAELTREQLTDIVGRIQRLLYLDLDVAGNEVWDPDRPWDPDTLNGIAQILAEYGLVPAGAGPASGAAATCGLPEELETLVCRIEESGDNLVLNQMIVELKGWEASELNRDGVRTQVEYVLSRLGPEAATQEIREFLPDDGNAGTAAQ
jgi:hypothetical protein